MFNLSISVKDFIRSMFAKESLKISPFFKHLLIKSNHRHVKLCMGDLSDILNVFAQILSMSLLFGKFAGQKMPKSTPLLKLFELFACTLMLLVTITMIF